jgi:hypothetical protein
MYLLKEKRGKYYNFISNAFIVFIGLSIQPFIFTVNWTILWTRIYQLKRF